MRFLFPVLAAAAVLSLASPLLAGSAYTNPCPVCGVKLGPFPTGNSGYMNRMYQQHLSSHKGGGGGGGGFAPASDPFMQFASQILGQMASQAGEEFAKSFWGDPQADREQAQVIAAERARVAEEDRQRAEEEARLREERHQALMAMMKRLPGSGGALKPKRLGDSDGGLTPKRLGDSPEYQKLMGSLARAAALSKMAAKAGEGDDAKLLAEEALRAAEGELQEDKVPDLGPCQEVSGEQASAFDRIQKGAAEVRKRYAEVSMEIARRHDQGEAYQKVREKTEETVKRQETQVAAAPPEKKAEEEDKLAKARALLEQAKEHEKKAEEDIGKLKKESEKLGSEMEKNDQAKEEFVKGLGK